MANLYWSTKDVSNFFRLKSLTTLYNCESRNEIPKAERHKKGNVAARKWRLDQIPDIGAKLGFIPKNKQQVVICKYIQKGGVLKTTTSFNEARVLALNGIKTLVIGLDFECSVTDLFLNNFAIENLKDQKSHSGLYHFFVKDADIKQIIQKTDIPTLDIIPETHDLVALDKYLGTHAGREEIFKNKLIPMLQQYDVIIFDNGPSWNHLIENAIYASDTIICPLGCNLLAFNASKTNFDTIKQFQAIKKLQNQVIVLYATLLERSAISQQIYSAYMADYKDDDKNNHTLKLIDDVPIRSSVKWQEALMSGISILEYLPVGEIVDNYYTLITKMWDLATRGNVFPSKTKSRKTQELVLEI